MFTNKVSTYWLAMDLNFKKRILLNILFRNHKTQRIFHNIPLLDFYEITTKKSINNELLPKLKKKHPKIDIVTEGQLNCSLQTLKKFQISNLDACRNLHLLTMNPITVDNYGEILKECGFPTVLPQYIINYHTIVRSRTIAQLKKKGLISKDVDLEERLKNLFHVWPHTHEISSKVVETSSSILNVRMKILQLFLNWRLNVSINEFEKYCRQYLPIKHKPMSDIEASIHFVEEELKLKRDTIKRNGFILATDPVNIKLIVEHVPSLAGLDIRDVVTLEPAILKNNYIALLKIRDILEEYRISHETQRKCLKVYCLTPKTVQERLEELIQMKEFNILSSNPRVLSMVVHKRKALARLDKIQTHSKQCYSLNHLVSSTKVFNNYITNFGNKACGRDLATLICSSLIDKLTNKGTYEDTCTTDVSSATEYQNYIAEQLKRHKYCLHVALDVVHENIQLLKKHFKNMEIVMNCALLLYPRSDIELYLNTLLKLQKDCSVYNEAAPLDTSYNNLDYAKLTPAQILSLINYELEKKYYFSGDGIWSNCAQQNIGNRSVSKH